MHADRISLALNRIETAALRIKEAARPRASATGQEPDSRYQALREEATEVLAELDQLIARLES